MWFEDVILGNKNNMRKCTTTHNLWLYLYFHTTAIYIRPIIQSHRISTDEHHRFLWSRMNNSMIEGIVPAHPSLLLYIKDKFMYNLKQHLMTMVETILILKYQAWFSVGARRWWFRLTGHRNTAMIHVQTEYRTEIGQHDSRTTDSGTNNYYS